MSQVVKQCCLCAVGCGCRTQAQHEFSVFWVPRRSIAVERVLEDEGVYGEVTQVGAPLERLQG